MKDSDHGKKFVPPRMDAASIAILKRLRKKYPPLSSRPNWTRLLEKISKQRAKPGEIYKAHSYLRRNPDDNELPGNRKILLLLLIEAYNGAVHRPEHSQHRLKKFHASRKLWMKNVSPESKKTKALHELGISFANEGKKREGQLCQLYQVLMDPKTLNEPDNKVGKFQRSEFTGPFTGTVYISQAVKDGKSRMFTKQEALEALKTELNYSSVQACKQALYRGMKKRKRKSASANHPLFPRS